MRGLSGSVVLSALVVTSCTEPKPPEDDDGTSTETTETESGSGETDGSTGSDAGGDSGSDDDGTSTGSDDGETSGTGGTGTTTDSTTSALACTGECVDPVPQGWQGPVAIASLAGDTAPGCSGDYPGPAFVAYETLDVPNGMCACECGEPQGTSCASTLDVSYGNTLLDCEAGTVPSVGPSCTVIDPVPVDTDNRYWKAIPTGPSGGSCTPTLTPVLGAPSWETAYSGCEGGLSQEPCEDPEDLCMTPPTEPLAEAICIWQDGDVDCPEGDYGVKTLLHGDYEDSRDCEACMCGDPTGTCTVPVVRMHAQDTCACITSACDFGTSCTLTPFDSAIYGLELITPSTVHEAYCEPSDPQVIGDAAATEPRTLCCTA